MKKNKLAVLTLTGMIAFGSMTNFVSAAPPDASEGNAEQNVIISEHYDIDDQEYAQISIEDHVNSFTVLTDEEKHF